MLLAVCLGCLCLSPAPFSHAHCPFSLSICRLHLKRDLPDGLSTYVGSGDQAIKLSGGQKQRVAIARAIMRQPTVLLLDEATSALDAKNESVVQAALDALLSERQQGGKGKGVALLIAHQLTTVQNCDKIIVIDKGAKVEEGTHEELLRIPIVREQREMKVPQTGVTGVGSAGAQEPTQAQMVTQMVSVTTAGVYHELWSTQMGESEEAREVRRLRKASGRMQEQLREYEREHDRQKRRSMSVSFAIDGDSYEDEREQRQAVDGRAGVEVEEGGRVLGLSPQDAAATDAAPSSYLLLQPGGSSLLRSRSVSAYRLAKDLNYEARSAAEGEADMAEEEAVGARAVRVASMA